MPLPIINAIWIGRELGPLHVKCLESFLRHGHQVVLYVYEKPIDCPSGIELTDAGRLLPKEMIFRNRKTGSYAPFSDLLRYELLYQGLGIYVDCDVFCLKPFPNDLHIFCEEKDGIITNSLLRLPPDNPVTIDLANMRKIPNFTPPWYSKKRLLKLRLLRLTGQGKLDSLHTNTLGPPAVTYYLKKHGMLDKAMPKDTYINNVTITSMLQNPSVKLADIITDRSIALHIGNSIIDPLHNLPPGCILKNILDDKI